MIIYYAKNKISKKMYIGKTTETLNRRKNTHINNAFNHNKKTVFYDALRSYGIDAFEWGVLEEVKDKSIINEKECYWIKKHKTHYIDGGKGYNMTIGGDGGRTYDQTGRKLNKKSIDKMKNSLKEFYSCNEAWNKGKTYKDDPRIIRLIGEKNGMFGKKHTEEVKEKLRQINLGRTPWNMGKSCSEETKEKIRKKMLGRYVSVETNIKKVLSRNKILLEQLIEIKNIIKNNEITEEMIIELSEKFKVKRSFIKNIKSSRIWNFIPES